MLNYRKFSLTAVFLLLIMITVMPLMSLKAAASSIPEAYEGVRTRNGVYKVALLDNDFTDSPNGCLTPQQETQLLDLMEKTAEKIKCNIGIAITSDLYGMSHVKYTENFTATMFGAYSDSVSLLLLNRHDNPAYASYTDYLHLVDRGDDLYRSKADKIFTKLYKPLDRTPNDFYSACSAFCSALGQYQSALGSMAANFQIDLTVVMSAVIGGIIVSSIAVTSVQRGYRKKTPISASHYIDKNRTRMIKQEDRFVREHTTSVHISSSSGGSHHSGGHSGGHHSSGHSGRGR